MKGHAEPAMGNVMDHRRCLTEGLQASHRELRWTMPHAIEHPIEPMNTPATP